MWVLKEAKICNVIKNVVVFVCTSVRTINWFYIYLALWFHVQAWVQLDSLLVLLKPNYLRSRGLNGYTLLRKIAEIISFEIVTFIKHVWIRKRHLITCYALNCEKVAKLIVSLDCVCVVLELPFNFNMKTKSCAYILYFLHFSSTTNETKHVENFDQQKTKKKDRAFIVICCCFSLIYSIMIYLW